MLNIEDIRYLPLLIKSKENERSKILYWCNGKENYYTKNISDDIKKMQDEYNLLLDKINSLSYPYSDIIKMYYIDGLTLNQIAFKLCYSYESILRYKKKAIKMICSTVVVR